jgi:hypothetical protein
MHNPVIFAKTFIIDSNRQLLVYKTYDGEKDKIIFIMFFDEESIGEVKVTAIFDSQEKCITAFDEFDQIKAEETGQTLIKTIMGK